jgi:TonB family protein
MKHHHYTTVLLFALAIAGTLSAQPRKKITVSGKGFPKTEEVYYVLKDDNTKKDGPYEVIRGGNVVCSGFYKDDQKDSVWEVYSFNNILLSRKWYQQGKRTGKWEFFTRSGEDAWTYDFNTHVLTGQPTIRSPKTDTATYLYLSPSGSWIRDSLDKAPIVLYSSGEWMRFLNTNLRYPDEAVNHNDQGEVDINITVDENGDAADYRVVKSATPALDAEALRVVKKFNFEFIPAEKDGKKVRMQYRVPLVFKLEVH